MAASRKRRGDDRLGPAAAERSGDSAPDGLVGSRDSLRLKALVFFAGAVLMGLEIAGSRVLAPHFGNSVFVWGSLITVFLAALSCGNYLGGWLADRRPAPVVLSVICMTVAVWIVGLSFFAAGACQALVDLGLGEEAGPLVASTVLFLPPSVGMGAVSPFAVRLAAASVATVGRTSGSLYALSTIGSIAGTIVTTFVLIPTFGLAAILRGLGAVLLAAALAALPNWRGPQALTGAVTLALIAMAPPPPGVELALRPGERLVVEMATPYHNIAVIDHSQFGVRQLRFDRYVESAIATEPPYASQAEYTHYFHLALLAAPQIERTLFIGAGGGIGPRTFGEHAPQMEIDVVDIDPAVLNLARSHFYLDDSPRLRTFAADGRMFVRTAERPYDCIVLDAFTIGGRIPFHLTTVDFFRACRSRMTDDGVFVMNINSAREGPSSAIYRSIYKTLDAAFPHVYVFAHEARFNRDPGDSTNILLVATVADRELDLAEWRRRAAGYASRSYVTREVLGPLVEDWTAPPTDLSTAPLLTDDFAPIETMTF